LAALTGRILAIVAACAALFFLFDFAATQLLWDRLYPEKALRIADPLFHHALKPYYSADDAQWGGVRYAVRTNALGFKDSTMRAVPKRAPGARLVFMGDSYTEGVGVRFEDTFVGQLAARAPHLDVLDAAAVSYSPSVYWRKTKWLLDQGYEFDQLVVYVDVSDVQDEAVFYREMPDGRIVDSGLAIDYGAVVGAKDPVFVPDRTHIWFKEHFYFAKAVSAMFRAASRSLRGVNSAPAGRAAPRKLLRAYWTVDPNLPGYGDGGVESGIAKAIEYMDRLKRLADERGIKLSVAVYPWPDQLDYDRPDSRQMEIWKRWCEQRGCFRFVDHFPDFFAYKRDHADWRERLFIPGDVHFTKLGNQIIADRLAASLLGQ